MIRELKEILLENEELTVKEKEKINKAVNIVQLGFTFEEVVKLFKERNIPLVLHEEDKAIAERMEGPDFQSTDQFILVHKTDFEPKKSILNAAFDKELYYTEEVNGNSFTIPVKNNRKTLHFSLNEEVPSHDSGDWDNCKYAILIPWKNVPNEHIVGGVSVDIIVNKSVDISNGYMLVPISEVERIQNNNPNLNVIGYEGERVLGYGDAFVETLGYRYECGGKYRFSDEEADKQFRKIMRDIGKSVHTHQADISHYQEKFYRSAYLNASIFEHILQNYSSLIENDINDIYNLRFTSWPSVPEIDVIRQTTLELAKKGILIPKNVINLLERINKLENGEEISTQKLFQKDEVQTIEDEYFLEQMIRETEGNTEELLKKCFNRAVLTAIIKKKGDLQNDSYLYGPITPVAQNEMKDKIIQKLQNGIIDLDGAINVMERIGLRRRDMSEAIRIQFYMGNIDLDGAINVMERIGLRRSDMSDAIRIQFNMGNLTRDEYKNDLLKIGYTEEQIKGMREGNSDEIKSNQEDSEATKETLKQLDSELFSDIEGLTQPGDGPDYKTEETKTIRKQNIREREHLFGVEPEELIKLLDMYSELEITNANLQDARKTLEETKELETPKHSEERGGKE